MNFTKHFYIEGQRIVSKLGEMGVEQDLLKPKSHAGDSTNNPVKWDNKKELTKDIIIANFEALGLEGAVFTTGKSGKVPYGQIKKYFRGNDVVINPGTPSPTTSQKTEDLQFYYHPDHLGSSNYITDVSGEVYQHQEYFPFGETFVEERNDAEYTTYLFNGKELDEETGLYYYGARYYDPRISMWYGVDPMTEKLKKYSPYAYAINNPVKFIDYDGLIPRIYVETQGVGHAFITAGEGKNTTVYTYGRYLGGDKGKSSANSLDPSGRGVMIKLTGKEAQRYIKHELKDMKAKAYEIKDASDDKVMEHNDKVMAGGRKLTNGEASKYDSNPNKYGTSADASVVDQYDLLRNNCTTKTIEAAEAGRTSVDFVNNSGPIAPDIPNLQTDIISPANLQEHLADKSSQKNSNVVNVTDAKNKELDN